MTLIEALKSGLPFRRKGDNMWCEPDFAHAFSKEAVLDEDWEVMHEPIVFECIWSFQASTGFVMPACAHDATEVGKKLHALFESGKRTRVTVEVLE